MTIEKRAQSGLLAWRAARRANAHFSCAFHLR
jgi:hypothetical protein